MGDLDEVRSLVREILEENLWHKLDVDAMLREELGFGIGTMVEFDISAYVEDRFRKIIVHSPHDGDNFVSLVVSADISEGELRFQLRPPATFMLDSVDQSTGQVIFKDKVKLGIVSTDDPESRYFVPVEHEAPDWRPEGSIPEDWIP